MWKKHFYPNNQNDWLVLIALKIILTSYSTVPNITITGDYTDLIVGSKAIITCTTIPSISNSDIIWLLPNNDGTIMSEQLILNPVIPSYNRLVHSCHVSSDLLSSNLTKRITVTVKGKYLYKMFI